MDMWRHQLEIHLLCLEKIFEMAGGFIVEFLKLWLEAPFGEEGVHSSICFRMLQARTGRHRLGKDGVAVVVINHQ
jgi:hypothetical protein